MKLSFVFQNMYQFQKLANSKILSRRSRLIWLVMSKYWGTYFTFLSRMNTWNTESVLPTLEYTVNGRKLELIFTDSIYQSIHSVEITQIDSHAFWQKFRENDVFTWKIIWPNIFSVRVNFSFSAHSVTVLKITEILSHTFLVKISWKQRFY